MSNVAGRGRGCEVAGLAVRGRRCHRLSWEGLGTRSLQGFPLVLLLLFSISLVVSKSAWGCFLIVLIRSVVQVDVPRVITIVSTNPPNWLWHVLRLDNGQGRRFHWVNDLSSNTLDKILCLRTVLHYVWLDV